jgi:ABC-type transporter Mla subunit MlaD
MRIRKFNEGENTNEIAPERLIEIIEELSAIVSDLDAKKSKIESIYNDLSNFKGKSTKSNDQIDDSVSNLQLSKSGIDECIDKIDSAVNSLKNYEEKGRQYLY